MALAKDKLDFYRDYVSKNQHLTYGALAGAARGENLSNEDFDTVMGYEPGQSKMFGYDPTSATGIASNANQGLMGKAISYKANANEAATGPVKPVGALSPVASTYKPPAPAPAPAPSPYNGYNNTNNQYKPIGVTGTSSPVKAETFTPYAPATAMPKGVLAPGTSAAPNHSALAPTPTPSGVSFDPNSYVAATAPMTQGVVTPEQTSQGQLNTMLSKNGLLMREAAAQGNRQAAARGLLNSSLAAGTAQEAMIKNAEPFALQDANTYANQSLANQKATNTSELASLQNKLDVTGKTTVAEQARQIALENDKYVSDLQSQRDILLSDVNASNDMAIQEQLGQINMALQNAKAEQALYQALATGNQELYNGLSLGNQELYNSIQLDAAQTTNKGGLQTSAQRHEMDMLNQGAFINKDTAKTLNGYQIEQMIQAGQITAEQAKENYGYDLGRIKAQAIETAALAAEDHGRAVDLLNRTEAFKADAALVAAATSLTYLEADKLAKLAVQDPQLAQALLVAKANNDTALETQRMQGEVTLKGHGTQMSIAEIQADNAVILHNLDNDSNLLIAETKAAAEEAIKKMELDGNIKFSTSKLLTDSMTAITDQGMRYRQQIVASNMTGPAKAVLIQNSLGQDASNINNMIWQMGGKVGNPPPTYTPLPPPGDDVTESITGFSYVMGKDGYLVPQGNGQPVASNTEALVNGTAKPTTAKPTTPAVPTGPTDASHAGYIKGPNGTWIKAPYAK
jgi:hypothetical protein